jgi:hypothetical protein
MTYKVTNRAKLPEGVTVAKRTRKNVAVSSTEVFPLTKMKPGDSFFVPEYTARDLRGIIHKYPRNRGMKFVSRTRDTGTRVWRIA